MRDLKTLCFCIAFAMATPLLAQDASRAILVLDGSGSMWGQVDGIAKITIAQEVVGELLGSLPATQALGLTVYGHRRKGDCNDIETMVAPGAGTREAIVAAVNGIKPKGKTPMTDAVQQAAEALRYTEEKATVILVSDGIETCNPDPCAAARILEETGVDFTAHVIGFDITDPEALRQMKCLAEETGGTFRSASNAAELGDALAVVAEPEPAPEPAPVTVSLLATDGLRGPRINDGLVWSLFQGDTTLVDGDSVASLTYELPRGEYRATVLRLVDEATQEAVFGVGEVDKQVVLDLPEFRPRAKIDAADAAVAGATLPVRWTGPNAEGDYISVAEPGEDGYIFYTYTREGPLLDLQMPPQPGPYELRYILKDGTKVLASVPIQVTPVEASVTAPELAPAGDSVEVPWTGPDYDGDYISVAIPEDDGYEAYAYTRKGSPAALTMPAVPGTYELRYVMKNGTTILAGIPITVTAVTASVTAPEDLSAGATVQVDWTGPDNKNDYIGVVPRGEDTHMGYAYTRTGTPAKIDLPAEPGEYDLVYVMNQDRTILARTPITVTAVTASVAAPEDLSAGATVRVGWTGPDNKNDYVAVVPRGEDAHTDYAYTRNGSPAEIDLPAQPGDYDLVYVMNQDRTVLARTPITVTAVTASITAPQDLSAGAKVRVDWSGPDNRNDYIGIVPRGEDAHTDYAYTRNGSPAEIDLPAEPGEYDLVYVMNQDRIILAREPIMVSAVTITLSAPDELTAGATVPVDWDGPDYPSDYIAVTERGESKALSYRYTRNGQPAMLDLPATAGDYDLVYVMRVGNTVVHRVPISVR